MSDVSFDAIRESAKMAVEQGVAEGIAAAMERFGAASKVPESGFFAAEAASEHRARDAAASADGGAKMNPRNRGRAHLRRAPVKPEPKRAKGAKRAPEDMQALSDRLLAHVSANEGESMEQIAKALDYATKELALPMRKLVANGKVKTEGVKRATRYFPR